MKRFLAAILTACACTVAVQAEIPEGYYDALDGKSGAELKAAVKGLWSTFVRVTYNTKTWPAFEQTDVRIVGGREAWWDMYSNNLVYLPAHDALNIEHCVANSWWGGKNGNNDAYSDLFHLNPSDQNANNKKSSYPPVTVADARLLDNGMLKVGTPAAGQGGGATNGFEPADEYKGDFARAYLYIFTTYADAPWQDDSAYVYEVDGELQPWAVELLLSWHRADPVDNKEKNRNEAIYGIQKNRNAYIDHPELVEYIWGDKQGESWQNGPASAAVNRPEAPVFAGARLTGINTYAHRWWDGYNQLIIHEGEGTLMLSIDGRDFFESTGETYIDPAFDSNERHTYKAYVKSTVDGHELRSSIASLTLVPLNPDETDYSIARWKRVTDSSEIEDGQNYILLSTNTLHAMSTDGGVPSKVFMESAGFVEFDSEGNVIEVPSNTAVIRLEATGDGKHRLLVSDTRNNYIGSWKATAKNAMNLKAEEYTPALAAIKETTAYFDFKFDEFGSLQFNKRQPRFLNYESNQSPVYLYKFLDFKHGSNIESITPQIPWAIGVDGNNILTGEGSLIFDLSGRAVSGRNLAPGTYIVVGEGKSLKIRI